MNEWNPHSKLNNPAPRPVKMNTACIILTIFLVIPFTSLSIFMIFIFIWSTFKLGLTKVIFSFVSFCIIFPITFFIFLYLFLSKYKHEKHILKYGEIAPATIITESEYDSRSGMLSEVTYSFLDNSGNVFGGSRKGIPAAYSQRDERNEIRALILSNPTALYDPEDGSKNILYPPRFVDLADR